MPPLPPSLPLLFSPLPPLPPPSLFLPTPPPLQRAAPELAQVVSALKKVEPSCLQLICCFLDPSRMLQAEEESAATGVGGNMDSPRQSQAHDPLYQLFCPTSPNEGKVGVPWSVLLVLKKEGGGCLSGLGSVMIALPHAVAKCIGPPSSPNPQLLTTVKLLLMCRRKQVYNDASEPTLPSCCC